MTEEQEHHKQKTTVNVPRKDDPRLGIIEKLIGADRNVEIYQILAKGYDSGDKFAPLRIEVVCYWAVKILHAMAIMQLIAKLSFPVL